MQWSHRPVDDKAQATEQRHAALVAAIGAGTMAFAGDGFSYDTPTFHLIANQAAMPQTVNNAVIALISGMTGGLGALRYRIRGGVFGQQGGASTTAQAFQFSSTTTLAATPGRVSAATFVTGAVLGFSSQNAINADLSTGAMGAGAFFFTLLEGWFQFSGAGTFTLNARMPTAGNPYTVADAFLDISPCTVLAH